MRTILFLVMLGLSFAEGAESVKIRVGAPLSRESRALLERMDLLKSEGAVLVEPGRIKIEPLIKEYFSAKDKVYIAIALGSNVGSSGLVVERICFRRVDITGPIKDIKKTWITSGGIEIDIKKGIYSEFK